MSKKLITTRALADKFGTSNIMVQLWLDEAGMKPVRQKITEKKHFRYWDDAAASAVIQLHRSRIDSKLAVYAARKHKADEAKAAQTELDLTPQQITPPTLKIVVPETAAPAILPLTPALTPAISIQDAARDKTISQIYFEVQILSSKMDKIVKALEGLSAILTMPEDGGRA